MGAYAFPTVSALAVSGTDVYAGGEFNEAGGNPATNIAKWNGSRWSALGEGVGTSDGEKPWVSALVASGGDLYAEGVFTMAAGRQAHHIAKWNGNT